MIASVVLNELIERRIFAATGKAVDQADQETLRIIGRQIERDANLDVPRGERNTEMHQRRSAREDTRDAEILACLAEDRRRGSRKSSSKSGRRRKPKPMSESNADFLRMYGT